jgi:hypothetical protein
MPTSKKNWKRGNFTEDIVYVTANNAQEAKEIAHDWILRKIDPEENADRPRRVAKHNYIRDTEKRFFDMKAKVVGSWSEIAKILEYASEKKEDPLQFFDDEEFNILADSLNNKMQSRLISGLSNGAKKALKKVLMHHEKLSEILPNIKINKDQVQNTKSTIPTRSIYLRKLTHKDADAIISRIKSYHDAIREGHRLGISKEELDTMVADRFSYEDEKHREEMKIYIDIYNKLKVRPSHTAFEDDPGSKFFQDRGFNWTTYATSNIPAMHLKTIPLPGFNPDRRGFDDYTSQSEYVSHMVPWLFDLYRKGPPKRMSQAARYKSALEQIIYNQLENKNQNTYQPESDEIPF